MSKIVELYVRKIRAGEMTIDDVPARWKAAVQALLDEDEE